MIKFEPDFVGIWRALKCFSSPNLIRIIGTCHSLNGDGNEWSPCPFLPCNSSSVLKGLRSFLETRRLLCCCLLLLLLKQSGKSSKGNCPRLMSAPLLNTRSNWNFRSKTVPSRSNFSVSGQFQFRYWKLLKTIESFWN